MNSSLLCFVVLSCVVALAYAGRGGRGRNREKDNGCSEWVMEDCTPRNGRACGRGTKKGTRTGETCALKEKTFKCRVPCQDGDAGVCKYSKRGAQKSECDQTSNTRTITLSLKKGGPECEATKTITKPCKNRSGGSSSTGRGRGKGKPCRYQRGEWSACDETTGMMSKTLTLKKGDPSSCEATKTITKQCKREKCTFGPWSGFGACQNGVRTKTREVTSGGAGCQSRAVKTRPCSK